MNVRVVFDYTIEKRQHVWMGAMLAAIKMYHDYVKDKRRGFPVGPEGHAENWFRVHMGDLGAVFERLVMNCFLQMLGQSNG